MIKQLTTALIVLLIFSACGNTSHKKRSREEIMQLGSELYFRNGCNVCHSLNGSEIYGPPLNTIYMKKITVIRNGKKHTLTADRRYLKKAITHPRYEKDVQYRNKEMPLTSFTNEEAELLVEYIIAIGTKNNTATE